MSDTINRKTVVQIGGMSSSTQAEQEAREFANPGVFRNRSAYFPNPQTHKVEVEIVSSVAKPWPKPPSPLNTFFVELTLWVKGDKKAVETWITRVSQMTRSMSPAAYSSVTERGRHLAETDKAVKTGAPIATAARATLSDREQNALDKGLPPPKKEGAKVVDPNAGKGDETPQPKKPSTVRIET